MDYSITNYQQTKYGLLFIILLTLSGCSTVADLQILNDNPSTRKVREAAAIATESAIVIGHKIPPKQINTTNANILYGEVKRNKNSKISFESLPYALQELQYIEQLSRSLK